MSCRGKSPSKNPHITNWNYRIHDINSFPLRHNPPWGCIIAVLKHKSYKVASVTSRWVRKNPHITVLDDETRRTLKDIAIVVNILAASTGMVFGLVQILIC
jgi:hypothetical protein